MRGEAYGRGLIRGVTEVLRKRWAYLQQEGGCYTRAAYLNS